MYTYKMDPTRTVSTTEQTWDVGRTDEGTDKRTDRRTDRVYKHFRILLNLLLNEGWWGASRGFSQEDENREKLEMVEDYMKW